MKKSKSVLLVDDDKDDHDFFIEALSGIENATLYYVASNGKEALDRLENSVNLPDIIFLDVNMPVMNGIECLSELKKGRQTKNIPVVILTSDKGQMDVARKLGAKAFLIKSSDHTTLRKQLEQMINLDFIADRQIANQTFQSVLSAL